MAGPKPDGDNVVHDRSRPKTAGGFRQTARDMPPDEPGEPRLFRR